MKTIYSLLSLFFIITTSFGQTIKIKEADLLFESYQYVDAIEAYQKIVDSKKANTHVYKQLADSYYNIFNVDEASKWYGKVVESSQDSETYYRYAQVLKSQGNYALANQQMKVFSQMMPGDQRSKTYLENPNYIPQLADKSKLFEIQEINNINDSKQSDFGAVLSNDNTLYFVSNRGNSKREDHWTNQPYLDIYQSTRNEDGSLTEPIKVEALNTIFHDGPLTISEDGKTMFFSRDGHSEGSFKKINNKNVKLAQQGLYKATLVDGKWGNIQALPINSKEYTVSHPSLSSDGKTLYFASNMPGGFGDTDIWKISINGNTYGTPENLGINVNTAGKEGFPFISENTILYFASSGRQGFGGFDIFKCDLTKNENAENLGNAVNTKSDDFSFSVNSSKKIGYFSSNRLGVDNIYSAIPICQVEVITNVTDNNSNKLLSNALVSIFDVQNNSIANQTTTVNGKVIFNVNCNKYIINISKEGYETDSFPIEAFNGKEVIMNASLKPINEMITEREVKLENIYFEYNESNVTQKGALELDKLVQIMNDYPKMNILVRSHSDSKGSQKYNKILSDKRAQSTVQYLISKGINKTRFTSEGVGSNEPKIDCKSNCSEEEDAQNRRSEFLIIKN